MKTPAKIIDVANRAGVAKSTVSNVLTGKKFVSDELKEKVMQACKELDFHPNFYASGLASGTSKIIALLLENSDNVEKSFYKDLIIACLKKAAEYDYSLLIYYNSDNEKLLNTLRQGMAPIDGAILMTPCINDNRLNQIASDCISCTLIGRPDDGLDFNYVDIDNVALVKTVCKKLISIYGKDIYLINSDFNLTVSIDRNKGFEEICKEYEIDLPAHLLQSKYSTEEDGYQFAKKNVKKDAVFITANACIAAGVYRAAQEAGLAIGDDVGVFALGRSVQHGSFTPKLSYAEQDYGILGAKAVEMLIEELRDGHTKKRILIESQLKIRQSTREE